MDRIWGLISDTDKDQENWGAIKDIKVLKRDGNTIEREAMVGPGAFARKSRQTLVLEPKRSIGMTMTGEGMGGERKIILVPTGENSTRVDVSWSGGQGRAGVRPEHREVPDLKGHRHGPQEDQEGGGTRPTRDKGRRLARPAGSGGRCTPGRPRAITRARARSWHSRGWSSLSW